MEYGKDLLAALAVILNCLPSAMLALSMGFSVLATAIGFALGAFGLAASGQVAVFSFQPETLLLLSRLSEDRNERLTITVCSSAFVFLLGVTGILGRIVTFIGDGAIYSLLAGMGVMVCKVAVDMLGDDKKTGLASIASAVAMYWLTADLVYTVAVSCIVSVVLFRFVLKGGHVDAPTQSAPKLLLLRPRFNVRVVKGVFSLAAMQLASIIAYSTVNNDLAGISGGLDSVSAILGASGLVSGMVSGSPLAPVISATASAPHPVLSGVIFMLLMAAILVLRVMPKLFWFIPKQAVCGFLFVLGALVIFPGNARAAVELSALAGGLSICVSAFADPFLGIIVGTLAYRLAARL